MRMISTLLWQIAIVLGLLAFELTTAATLAAGFFIGLWFCIINMAVYLGRSSNE